MVADHQREQRERDGAVERAEREGGRAEAGGGDVAEAEERDEQAEQRDHDEDRDDDRADRLPKNQMTALTATVMSAAEQLRGLVVRRDHAEQLERGDDARGGDEQVEPDGRRHVEEREDPGDRDHRDHQPRDQVRHVRPAPGGWGRRPCRRVRSAARASGSDAIAA